MNACGHHHVGNIGVLGVDKNGEEVSGFDRRRAGQ
jgi:sulfite reductase beta subunit-like hemoprotein